MGPLVPLFWTYGDVCLMFQSQGGPPYLCASSPTYNRILRFTSEGGFLVSCQRRQPYTVADLHSKILDAPPRGPNSFNFMQFLGKFGKIVCWRPPGELAPPPRGNPGSATATQGFTNSRIRQKCQNLTKLKILFYAHAPVLICDPVWTTLSSSFPHPVVDLRGHHGCAAHLALILFIFTVSGANLAK